MPYTPSTTLVFVPTAYTPSTELNFSGENAKTNVYLTQQYDLQSQVARNIALTQSYQLFGTATFTIGLNQQYQLQIASINNIALTQEYRQLLSDLFVVSLNQQYDLQAATAQTAGLNQQYTLDIAETVLANLNQQYDLLARTTSNSFTNQRYKLLSRLIQEIGLNQLYSQAGSDTDIISLTQQHQLLVAQQQLTGLNQQYDLLTSEQQIVSLTQQYQLLTAVEEALAEVFNLSDVVSDAIFQLNVLSETIILSDAIANFVEPLISEAISITSVQTDQAIFSNLLQSDITVDDIIQLIFPVLLQENITMDDTLSVGQLFVEALADILTADDTVTEKLIAAGTLVDAFIIADLTIAGLLGSVAEDFSITDTVAQTLARAGKVLEDITIHLDTNTVLVFLASLSDEFTLDNSITNTASLSDLLSENIVMMSLPPDIVGDSRIGYVMNPETFAVWNYDKYDFNSLTFPPDTTTGLMANSTGLYQSGGDLDLTAFITSRLKTAAIDFSTSNLKQVPEVYLGLDMTGDMVLVVRTEERVEVKYRLVNPTDHSGLQHINLGKGLISNNFQFELIDSENTQFDLTSIELMPILFSRKRR